MEALAFINLFGTASEVFKMNAKDKTVEVIGEVTCIVIEPVTSANPFDAVGGQGDLKVLTLGSVWKFRDMQDDGTVKVLGGKWYALVEDTDEAF